MMELDLLVEVDSLSPLVRELGQQIHHRALVVSRPVCNGREMQSAEENFSEPSHVSGPWIS